MGQTVLMQSKSIFSSTQFVFPFAVSFIVFGLFVLWQLGIFSSVIYSLPRGAPTTTEWIFGGLLVLLLSMNIGLFAWQKRFGSCPIGTKRASGIASTLGVLALLCPVCLALPLGIFGASVLLSSLSVYIPMLQIISIVLLIVSLTMLWPKSTTTL